MALLNAKVDEQGKPEYINKITKRVELPKTELGKHFDIDDTFASINQSFSEEPTISKCME